MTTNVGTTTTYFVGNHYEVTGADVTKYYYAGSQRIAMRKGDELMFIIGDHLGSTSIVTDDEGAVISETKYKAWGEVRYTSGTSPTEYTYTGQYSYTDDFGLMFYNARWYDSSLSRFAQADSIIPGIGNPDAWDRYSYTLNNPIQSTDPSGHIPVDCMEKGYCGTAKDPKPVLDSIIKPKPKPEQNPAPSLTPSPAPSNPTPQVPMTLSAQGEELIKYYEDLVLYPYPDLGNNCTIGWGHLLQRGGCSGWPNKTYGNGINPQLAQLFFDQDIAIFENLINVTITVNLNQAQFDALVSYTFNTGDQTNNPYFVKEIPDLINSGNFGEAAEAIRSGPITSGGLESNKLIERRQVETNLFLYGIYFP